MMKYMIALYLLASAADWAFGDQAAENSRVVQDPETKVIYYMESDRHHIVALSPDGKLLWNCEVISASDKLTRDLHFGLWRPKSFLPPRLKSGADYLRIEAFCSGWEQGLINKKTGIAEWDITD
jgi:hypothetical protein